MASSVYQINKGVNRSIEFKGLRSQYIMYVGAGMILLIMIFFILYALGVNQYISLLIVLPLGGFMLFKIYGLSRKYGEHGMMKMLAKKSVPKSVRVNSRRCFTTLKKESTKKRKRIS